MNIPKKNPKLIMTLLARDEEDIIKQNIEFHLSHGVDFIIATDNASVDNTRKILREYEKKGKLFLIDESGRDKSQSIWNNRMTKIAIEKYDADIIFHCDADEFWYPISGNLKNEIIKSSDDVLSVNLINILLKNQDGKEFFPRDAAYAVVTPLKPSDYEKETRYENLYFYKYPKKVIFKTTQGILEVGHGNHTIISRNKDISKAISKNIFIFHFPLRDRKRFFNKVIETGKAVEKNKLLAKNESFHIRRWFEAYNNNNLDKEYEKLIIKESAADKFKENGFLVDFDFSLFIQNKEMGSLIRMIQQDLLEEFSQEIRAKEKEIRLIKSSKFWKLQEKLAQPFHLSKSFFGSFKQEGVRVVSIRLWNFIWHGKGTLDSKSIPKK